MRRVVDSHSSSASSAEVEAELSSLREQLTTVRAQLAEAQQSIVGVLLLLLLCRNCCFSAKALWNLFTCLGVSCNCVPTMCLPCCC